MRLNHKHYSLIDKALSRRSFLAGAGGVAAASMLTGCSNDGTVTTPTSAATGAYTDLDILNFALNLEYVEAQFYLFAAGTQLSAADTVAPTGYTGTFTKGTVTAPAITTGVSNANTAQLAIINEIAAEEQHHVQFLRAALGSAAVPMPSVDLTFFAALAGASNTNYPNGTIPATFSPFASFDAFLVGAFIFEDVGVTAYSGAAPLISAAGVTSGYLNAAAGILAVEAYHAAYARTALTASAISLGATNTNPTPYPYVSYANQVAKLRNTLTVGNNSSAPSAGTGNTGAPGTSSSDEVYLNIPTTGTGTATTSQTSIVQADSANALGFARTVNQVLHIVYGSATVGVKSGGFFPSGMNSIFATTTA